MDIVLATFLFLGLPFFLYWLCCGGVFYYVQSFLLKSQDNELKVVREECDNIPRDSWKNYWVVLYIVVEIFQLTAYCLDETVFPWPLVLQPVFGGIFNFSFLRFNGGKGIGSFWLMAVLAIMYAVIVFILLIGAIWDIEKINNIKDRIIDLPSGILKDIGEFLLFELPPLIYLPLAWTMFNWLSCSYNTSPPILTRDPSVVCWQGIHLAYAITAIFCVILFFPIALLVSAGRVARENCQVKVKSSFLIVSGMLKFLVAAITTFFSSFSLLYWGVLLGVDILLLLACFVQRPANIRLVNLWHSAALCISTWSAVCAGVCIFVNSDGSHSEDIFGWLPVILLGSGIIIILVVFGSVHLLRYPTKDIIFDDLGAPLNVSVEEGEESIQHERPKKTVSISNDIL